MAFPGLRLAFAGLRRQPSSPRHIPVPTIPGQSALTVTPSRATSGQGIAETDHGKLRGTVVGEVWETDLAGDR